MATRPAPGNKNRVYSMRQDLAELRSENNNPNYNPKGRGKVRVGRPDRITDFIMEENPITSAIKGTSGLYNLVTSNPAPEPKQYSKPVMVRAGARGGMPSGGAPTKWDAVAALLAGISSGVTPRDRTSIEEAVYKEAGGRPRDVMLGMQNLSEADKTRQSIEQRAAEDKKSYESLLDIVKTAGIPNQDELFRGAVVSPDGNISFNPTVNAALGNVMSAGDALRLLDLVGLGTGKAAGVGARFGVRAGRKAVENVATKGIPASARFARPVLNSFIGGL